MSRLCASLCVLFAVFAPSQGIRCYVCNSYSDLYCSENWDLKDLAEEIQPIDCDETYEAQYCVKTTGMYQGEIGTRRFCSAKHLGNYCDWNSRPGDVSERGGKREYRSCILTCATDGCNSSLETKASSILLFVPVMLIALRLAAS